MHLISALLCGIPGAANGTAELYQRGTATRATWYEDFEGHGADSSGADIDLSSTGHAVVYVAELVEVVVKSSAGTTLRQWVDGVSANCVEVRSGSFTGVDYDTAKSAAGNPTNLDAVLELWDDSAGAIDWEVGSGGTPLDDAITAVAGVFYNVKAYGAVGDGVTNDRNAFVDAGAAATAAGGGTLFVPPGTYLIGSTLSLGSNGVKGAGAGVSILRLTSASGFINSSGLLEDLTIDSSLTKSSALINVNGGCRMVRCSVGTASFAAAAAVGINTGSFTAELCTFQTCNTSGPAVLENSGGSIVTLLGCRVVYDTTLSTTYTGTLIDFTTGATLRCVGCTLTLGTATTGAATFISILLSSSGRSLLASGCVFEAQNSPVAVGIKLNASTLPAVTESGNSVNGWSGTPGNFTMLDLGTATLSPTVPMELGSRRSRRIEYLTDSNVTIDNVNYEHVTIRRTTNAAQTVTVADSPEGCLLTLLYHNDHAGAGGTITFDTTRVDMVAASNQFSVAANSYRLFQLVSRQVNGNFRLCEVPMALADEPE